MVQDANAASGVTMPVDLLAGLAKGARKCLLLQDRMRFCRRQAGSPDPRRRGHIGRAHLTVKSGDAACDLDAGANGTMTSAMFPRKDQAAPRCHAFNAVRQRAALAQWQKCLPLIKSRENQGSVDFERRWFSRREA